jgi:hypothetical protein
MNSGAINQKNYLASFNDYFFIKKIIIINKD